MHLKRSSLTFAFGVLCLDISDSFLHDEADLELVFSRKGRDSDVRLSGGSVVSLTVMNTA